MPQETLSPEKHHVNITARVTHAESSYGRDLAGELEGIASSAERTFELFAGTDTMRRFGHDVREFYQSGKLDEHLVTLTGPDGEHFAMIESQGVQLVARHLPGTSTVSKSKPEWKGALEVTLRYKEFDVGRVFLAAEIIGALGGLELFTKIVSKLLIKVTLFAVRICARFIASLTGSASISAFAESVAKAERLATRTATRYEISGGVEVITADAKCLTAVNIGLGLLLVAVGLVLELALSNVMHHQLRIFNATDSELEWEIAHIDTGQIYRYPTPSRNEKGKAGTAGTLAGVQRTVLEVFGEKIKTDQKVGQFGEFATETSSIATGVGYLLKLRLKNGESPLGYVKIVIPYSDPNRIALIGPAKGRTPAEIFENRDHDHAKESIEASLGGFQLKLSMDKLQGKQRNPINLGELGYYYDSVLHIEEPGVWNV